MKKANFVYLILLVFMGCKKNIQNIQQNNVKLALSNSKNEKATISKSFVISCGSGCAMTYIAQNISQDQSTLKVKFKVEMYTDEELSDTYYETYIFFYNNGKIEKINIEGKKENILENLMPDAQDSFRVFAADIIHNKDINLSKFEQKKLSNEKKYNLCELPFDFESYYNICNENEKECQNRYPSYTYPENKNILESYGISDAPTSFFLIPQINGFQPIILAYTDSDVEGYYLKISNNNKVISSLQIAKFDGETVNDFTINKDFEIELYSRTDTNEKRILKKKYKIQKDGSIN
jgi:hypothetical protein